MPKHIKKAGYQYKQMCGCQACIISKNMYACVEMWRKKYVARARVSINDMPCCREKVLKQERLDEYIAKVMVDKCISPERAWDAISGLACPKIEIQSTDEDFTFCSFHKFGCTLDVCDECPQWNDFIHQMGRDCTDVIRYTIFGSYFQCIKHG
jgi:hypothetical protein